MSRSASSCRPWRRARSGGGGSGAAAAASLDFGVEIGDRSVQEIAVDVGRKASAEFGRQEGELLFIKRAPLKRQEIWKNLGVTPRGIDRG
jgi:carbon-monoxide dehydrogenase catalytic subunit